MSKFRLFNYLHIRCVDCNKVTALNPGDYDKIISDCECNKPKKRKTNGKQQNKTPKTNSQS